LCKIIIDNKTLQCNGRLQSLRVRKIFVVYAARVHEFTETAHTRAAYATGLRILTEMPNPPLNESLYDPREGAPAICVQSFSFDTKPVEPPRTNYFSIYWIEEGAGNFWADAGQYAFEPAVLLFFITYQHIRFEPVVPVRGTVLHFHANFLCVETFHAEVGCSGTLFNDPYGIPVVHVDEPARLEMTQLIGRMQREQAGSQLAFHEVLLAYLKVLLIQATRLKAAAAGACSAGMVDLRNPVLGQLQELIEQNYRRWHAPADYADALHMTPKTLGRVVREQLGKTLTDLIQARILTHAKWQLLHTLRPVKEIAREIGFTDELYFSRLFKKATGVSPRFFREVETEIRGGSNLSMFSSVAPIQ
jgi:AraC family transcriptional activator of pobA